MSKSRWRRIPFAPAGNLVPVPYRPTQSFGDGRRMEYLADPTDPVRDRYYRKLTRPDGRVEWCRVRYLGEP
jgi:hypothetical protein